MNANGNGREMDTDALVRTLAAENRPAADRHKVERSLALGAAAGLAGVVAAVLALGDVRPDLLETLGGAGLSKFGGGVALAAGAFHMLRRLGRPGTGAIDGLCLGLFALAAAIVAGVVATAQVTAPLDAVLRQTPRYAALMILLSAIPLATVLPALRVAAPTRPAGAGAAAGLLAGSLTALGYALWCPADDALFVAVSYGAAIATTALAGCLLGARVLRW
ncbi:MAG: NrsF family protein [Paracoccaceae bacterium]